MKIIASGSSVEQTRNLEYQEITSKRVQQALIIDINYLPLK